MAFYPSKLILSLLFVVATAASVAHSIPFPIPIPVQLSVAGRVVCTVPGTNCPKCPGIAGVNVTLSCDGGRTTLAQAVTNKGGLVNLILSPDVLSAVNGPLFGQSQCFVYVKLPICPINNCNVFRPSGILRSPVTFVNIVGQPARVLINFTFGIFSYVI